MLVRVGIRKIFLVTVTAIIFSENDEQRLYDITLIAENQELFSEKNGDMELYCNINVPKNILTEETDNHFTILQRKTKEYHYKFFLPKEISDFECQVEIPLAADRRYKKVWSYRSGL